MPSCYLAGPITGLTYDEGADWRDLAARELGEAGIVAFSPLRCKQYLRDFGKLDNAGTDDGHYVGVNPLSDPPGITMRDRYDCTHRDVVLANFLGADRVSIGTCIELGWADATRRPIVVVMEPGNVHAHAMVNQIAGYVVPTLDAGLAVVKAILLP